MKDNSKKITGVLKETFKLPTAVQLRKYIKDKRHVWTDLDRIVAPSVLLLDDVFVLHSSMDSLLETYKTEENIKKAKEAALKRIECLDSILVKLKKSSFDYNVALMSPPEDKDENGVPLRVSAEIRITEDRKVLLDFIKLIDKYRYGQK